MGCSATLTVPRGNAWADCDSCADRLQARSRPSTSASLPRPTLALSRPDRPQTAEQTLQSPASRPQRTSADYQPPANGAEGALLPRARHGPECAPLLPGRPVARPCRPPQLTRFHDRWPLMVPGACSAHPGGRQAGQPRQRAPAQVGGQAGRRAHRGARLLRAAQRPGRLRGRPPPGLPLGLPTGSAQAVSVRAAEPGAARRRRTACAGNSAAPCSRPAPPSACTSSASA